MQKTLNEVEKKSNYMQLGTNKFKKNKGTITVINPYLLFCICQ